MKTINKFIAAIVSVILSVSFAACSSSGSSTTEDFASIVKEETSNFLSGADQMTCGVEIGMATFAGWNEKSSNCRRDIEVMVFAAQRIVSKFNSLNAPAEVEGLVAKTIAAIQPIATSNYENACSKEALTGDMPSGCTAALQAINGSKQFVLADAWDALDGWQPYF